MKKLSMLLLAFIFLGGQLLYSQSTTISNVLDMKSAKQSGNILENDKIVGYYVFYFKEKTSKTTAAYEIELFDDNYNSVQSFEIERPKNTAMLQMAYNETNFLLAFYDYKKGFEFVTFNREGKEQGSVNLPAPDRKTLMSKGYGAFYARGTTGFIRTWGNEIIGYNNEMEKEWTYEAEKIGKKGVTSTGITSISDDYIVATAYKKKSLTTKKMDIDVILLNAKTGNLISVLEMGNAEKGKKSVLQARFNEEEGKIFLVGEYFKPGDDIMKDISEGLFIQELDGEGNILQNKIYNWEEDIDSYQKEQLNEEDLKEMKKRFSLYFHDVVVAENGHIYMVAEQFKKQVSAGGVASQVISGALGGASNAAGFEVRIGNMVMIEFDQDYELVDFRVVTKKKSSVMLQAGLGFYGTAFLGHYVKSTGGFDYSFTSRNTDLNVYDVVYTDLDRKAEESDKNKDKADRMLGVIRVDAEGVEASRVPINTDAKYWWLREAKPGYISIFEYDKKLKELSIRLEQISY